MAGLSPKTARRTGVGGLALLIGVGLLSGCDDRYSDDLVDPPRTDPIVESLPEKQPDHLDRPGELDLWIKDLANKGGKLLDPGQVPRAQAAVLEQVLTDTFGKPAHPK